jgi:hypothetical protein
MCRSHDGLPQAPHADHINVSLWECAGLKRDSQWLKAQNLMDYSLLVGLCEVTGKNTDFFAVKTLAIDDPANPFKVG